MPDRKKELISYLIDEHKLSIRQACSLINFNRSSYYYKKQIDELEVQVILEKLSLDGYSLREIQELLEENNLRDKQFKKKILSSFLVISEK